MGTRSSTLANPQCPACGGPALDSDKINPQFCLCKRCGGYVETEAKQAPVPSQVGGGAYDAVNASDDSKEESALQGPLGARRLPQLRVKLVHILPFRESLPDEDRDADERLLLEKYIIPFFAGGGHVVESGARFQINSVDFKVVSCFPPYGLTAPDTVFRSMMGHLSALSQLQKIHILPTAASIAVSNAKHLFDNNLRPYFAGPDHRHMMEGDTFVSQGVQFKVIAAVPTNGVVTERTEIFTEGEPLRDADRIHILPIYETLPNRDKRLTAEERFKKYLEPFFLGRFQVVAQGQEIAIDGVDWKVIACDPPRGVVTYKTIIFAAGDALRADDVKRQQMEEDERLAMELQRQEGGLMMPPPGAMLRVSAPGWPGGGPVLIPVGGMRGGPPLAAAMNQRAELRHRLQELLRIMPPNDRNRVVIQRLHDRLSQPPAAADGAQMVNFFRLMQALQESNPESNGASVEEIDALPTRKFVPFEHSEEKAEEALKCMVCLCEYSDGEELRTLPCFHSYHKECIDKWLSNNVKCPICKHPIN